MKSDVNDVFKKHEPVNKIIKTLQNENDEIKLKTNESNKKGSKVLNEQKDFSKYYENISPRSKLKSFFINFCKTAFDSVKYDMSQYNLMKNDFCSF